MTTNEAITWFERRKAGSAMPGAKMAYDMALDALRTQREPNKPLTLDELRDMTGHWVWVVVKYDEGECQGWALVAPSCLAFLEQFIPFASYGEKVIAYHRRPKEG